jgi:putative glutamine amidotransferase
MIIQFRRQKIMSKPPILVWLPVDHRNIGEEGHSLPFVVLGDKYARAVRDGMKAQPVLFPLAGAGELEPLLEMVDGVMLTGSPSNVEPAHYGQDVQDSTLPLDPQRDAQTLALIRACLRQSVPLLGICRGLQEINVALGGSLHQQVHLSTGLSDHRDPAGEPLDVQYGLAHEVALAPGSVLEQWAGKASIRVNSLHGQGIDRLAKGLRPLAKAADGLIEAFEVEDAPTFAMAVQWHPEWRCLDNPFYLSLFQAFGKACRARHAARNASARSASKQAEHNEA